MPSVRSGHITWKLDDAGEFNVVVPQAEGAAIKPGDVIVLTRNGQDVARVYVTDSRQRADGDYQVRGHTLIAELSLLTTGQGRSYGSQAVDAVVDDLIAPAGWTRSGSMTQLVSVRFDGKSLLEAVHQVVVQQAGGHFRDESTTTTRTVAIGLGQDSGVVIDSTRTRELWLVEDATDVVNAIMPLGSGTGDSQVTLEHQTKLPNLLSNPSFEQGTGSWTAYGTGASVSASTARAAHGKQSLLVTAGASAEGGARQTVSVTAGREYRLEAWAWLVSGASAGARVVWLDSSGGTISSAQATTTTSGRWELLRVTATAPAGAVQARVELFCPASAQASFDLARFWQTAASAGQPLEVETKIPLPTAPFPGVSWVLVDYASVSQYGRREIAATFKEVTPISNSTQAMQAAANSLYDMAAAYVAAKRSPKRSYRLSLSQDVAARPGDKVRLVWQGPVRTPRGSLQVDVNDLYWVISKTRRFLPDGRDIYGLNLASQPLGPQTTVTALIGQVQDLARHVSTVAQTSVANWTETHALQQALDPNGALSFDLTVPDNCVALLLCKLRLAPRPIRATAKSALSNASYTSSAGSSHSHRLSGVTTDSGGGTATATQAQAHYHGVAAVGTGVLWSNPTFKHGIVVQYDDGNIYTLEVSSSGDGAPQGNWITNVDSPAHSHNVSIPNHNHSFSTQTTAAETSHTHTIGGHTHGLEYGIFEGTTPLDLRIVIDSTDRTAELGGPWNAKAVLDITRYLLDANGLPARGDHTVTIQTSRLGAVDVKTEWVAVVAAVRPA